MAVPINQHSIVSGMFQGFLGVGTLHYSFVKLFTDRSSFFNCGTCDLARAVAQGAGYMGSSALLLLMFSELPVQGVSGTRGSQHRPRCSCNAWCST